jgi:hypothetical protein
MIRKSMPSGNDPMGGNRFSEKDHAQTKPRTVITLSQSKQPAGCSFLQQRMNCRISDAVTSELWKAV